MNRIEALHILGLDEEATQDDIRTAWRESAQILHPDRFTHNKKLQDRATEQFKTLQEAYSFLISEGSSKASRGRRNPRATAENRSSDYEGSARFIEAQIAGIIAARTQLVKQRDAVCDERRMGLILACAGSLVVFATLRRPYGLFGVLAALGSAAAVWGAVQTVSTIKTLEMLDERIEELRSEEKRLRSMLD